MFDVTKESSNLLEALQLSVEVVSNFTHDRKTSSSLSAHESFSLKASTALSSARAVNQDLSDDIKELEEENEVLNQEMDKLRIQYHKALQRLRNLEAQQESKKLDSPVIITNHVNG